MAETFLNAVTDLNAVTEAINENGEGRSCKDMLMRKISYKVVDGKEERYPVYLAGQEVCSVLLANVPINKTFRPYEFSLKYPAFVPYDIYFF